MSPPLALLVIYVLAVGSLSAIALWTLFDRKVEVVHRFRAGAILFAIVAGTYLGIAT